MLDCSNAKYQCQYQIICYWVSRPIIEVFSFYLDKISGQQVSKTNKNKSGSHTVSEVCLRRVGITPLLMNLLILIDVPSRQGTCHCHYCMNCVAAYGDCTYSPSFVGIVLLVWIVVFQRKNTTSWWVNLEELCRNVAWRWVKIEQSSFSSWYSRRFYGYVHISSGMVFMAEVKCCDWSGLGKFLCRNGRTFK